MQLTSAFGKIEISESVLAELVARIARECAGVQEMAPRNLTDNLVGLLGFDGRGRGVAIKQSEQGLIITVRLQFRVGLSIAVCTKRLVNSLRQQFEEKLGVSIHEVRVDVVTSQTDRSA